MKKKVISTVVIALVTLFSLASFCYCLWSAIANFRMLHENMEDPLLAMMEKSARDAFISSCRRSAVHEALFALCFFLMSACLIFLILRKNKVQLSYAIRYSREKRTERRSARLEKKKEEKRKKLEEQLERINH